MEDNRLTLIEKFQKKIEGCSLCSQYATIKNVPRAPDFANFKEEYQIALLQNYPRINDTIGAYRLNDHLEESECTKEEKVIRDMLKILNIEYQHVYSSFILKCPYKNTLSIRACRTCVKEYLSKELPQSIKNWVVLTQNKDFIRVAKQFLPGIFDKRDVEDKHLFIDYYNYKGKKRKYIYMINPSAIRAGVIKKSVWLDKITNAILR